MKQKVFAKINRKKSIVQTIHVNAFLRKTINKAMTRPNHAHMYSDQGYRSVFVTEWNKYVFKRELNDDSDGAHLISFGIEFQTEEEATENERSPSVALLCAGLLWRGMVYELQRVLRVRDGFICSMPVTYDGAVLLWQW